MQHFFRWREHLCIFGMYDANHLVASCLSLCISAPVLDRPYHPGPLFMFLQLILIIDCHKSISAKKSEMHHVLYHALRIQSVQSNCHGVLPVCFFVSNYTLSI